MDFYTLIKNKFSFLEKEYEASCLRKGASLIQYKSKAFLINVMLDNQQISVSVGNLSDKRELSLSAIAYYKKLPLQLDHAVSLTGDKAMEETTVLVEDLKAAARDFLKGDYASFEPVSEQQRALYQESLRTLYRERHKSTVNKELQQ